MTWRWRRRKSSPDPSTTSSLDNEAVPVTEGNWGPFVDDYYISRNQREKQATMWASRLAITGASLLLIVATAFAVVLIFVGPPSTAMRLGFEPSCDRQTVTTTSPDSKTTVEETITCNSITRILTAPSVLLVVALLALAPWYLRTLPKGGGFKLPGGAEMLGGSVDDELAVLARAAAARSAKM